MCVIGWSEKFTIKFYICMSIEAFKDQVYDIFKGHIVVNSKLCGVNPILMLVHVELKKVVSIVWIRNNFVIKEV